MGFKSPGLRATPIKKGGTGGISGRERETFQSMSEEVAAYLICLMAASRITMAWSTSCVLIIRGGMNRIV